VHGVRIAGLNFLKTSGLNLSGTRRLVFETRRLRRTERRNSLAHCFLPRSWSQRPRRRSAASRIAKRISLPATVVMSSISMVMLSPGMTIFTPSGSMQEPVTSVVRM
jgi:hypothetical protein